MRADDEVRSVLAADRAATVLRIMDITGEFDELVAASVGANIDDEHDPEGATIAFERAQLAALLDQARRHLDDVDAAMTRLDRHVYPECERCRGPISADRLSARPAARTCLACAAALSAQP